MIKTITLDHVLRPINSRGLQRDELIKVGRINRTKLQATILRVTVKLSAFVTIGILTVLVGYILVKGIPCIKAELFEWKYTSTNGSLMPALINTLLITVLALAFAVPIGVGAAIYLVEYATKGNRAVKVIRVMTETLSGIPSIVYGLFGYLMFVSALKMGYSMLSGAVTLAIMILPVILRTTEESLKSVSDMYREGSFGLGAGKLRTVFSIVLPTAAQGIFSGIILAVGRIVGETAALIYTAGTVAKVPGNVMGSGRTLSVHMYMLWSEGMETGKSYATAVILLLFVFVLNAVSQKAADSIGKRRQAQ